MYYEFLSTPSARRATSPRAAPCIWLTIFLSTPSARRATAAHSDNIAVFFISIHALREEGDRDLYRFIADFGVFLSTPSARRATSSPIRLCQTMQYFYPRPPRGGRRLRKRKDWSTRMISIHALREEGDFHLYVIRKSLFAISIHALREEGDLPLRFPASYLQSISIHALREEGDAGHRPQGAEGHDFYPRPPRGGRLMPSYSSLWVINFYPRPPRGGRQQKQRQNLYFQTNYTTFCTNLEEP